MEIPLPEEQPCSPSMPLVPKEKLPFVVSLVVNRQRGPLLRLKALQ